MYVYILRSSFSFNHCIETINVFKLQYSHMIIILVLSLYYYVALLAPNEINIISTEVYFHANGSPLVDLEIQVCIHHYFESAF